MCGWQNFCVPGFACLPGKGLCGKEGIGADLIFLLLFVSRQKVKALPAAIERAGYRTKYKYC
jgi:hypothetical protein